MTADGVLHPLSRVELICERPNVVALDFCHAYAKDNTHVVDMCVGVQGIDEKHDNVATIEQDFGGDLYIPALWSRQEAPYRSLGP